MKLMLFILGSVIGSFVGATVSRVHRFPSILYGRSHCDTCHQQLTWYHLIPLLSYATLKGRCSYCGARLSKKMVLVELAYALIMVRIFTDTGTLAYKMGLITFLAVLGLITGVDWNHYLIYDRFHGYLIATQILIDPRLGFLSNMAWAILVLLVFSFVAYSTKGLGWGDVKLLATLCLCLGPSLFMHLWFLALLGACLYSAYCLMNGTKSVHSEIPLGSFIALSTMIVLL